jgi:predicted glycogen debranching enzyme
MDWPAASGRDSDANRMLAPAGSSTDSTSSGPHLLRGELEWLETSRSGDFALGTVDRKLRRKYHSLLTVREPGRGDSWNVLAEMREELTLLEHEHEHPGRAVLSEIQTGTGEGAELVAFSSRPHASHTYRALDLTIQRTVQLTEGHDQVELHYKISGLYAGVELALEPLLLCRAIHELTFENPFLDGSFSRHGDELRMVPYAGMPAVAFRVDGIDRRAGAEGRFVHDGRWITDVHYAWEAERGYPAHEHLFSPGRFIVRLPINTPEVELTFVIGLSPLDSERAAPIGTSPSPRLTLAQKLERAAKQFLMTGRSGNATVIAGFPWFGAWSRDTLIALPGLQLATGDFELSAAVLEGMLHTRVNGLIPNIPAVGDYPPDTSSIDASLLFVRTVQWLGTELGPDHVERFMPGVCELLEAIADSRDLRMHLDRGVGVWTERGPWALTWMDALIDGQPVTPRAGYAIEIDALAYNAARFASEWASQRGGAYTSFARAFRHRLRTAEADFVRRYWDDARGYLADGHDGLAPDRALRPNQLFALGLPYRAVPPAIARAALEAVSRTLLVPAGLRTLSPHHPAYRGQYEGAQRERDLAYHQGTAWPWLAGIYADAVRLTHGREALEARLSPLLTFFARHIDEDGCLGQVSEVFSGDAPHAARGAPAQAWSVAELYRVLRML